MESLIGNGQPGRIARLEDRLEVEQGAREKVAADLSARNAAIDLRNAETAAEMKRYVFACNAVVTVVLALLSFLSANGMLNVVPRTPAQTSAPAQR